MFKPWNRFTSFNRSSIRFLRELYERELTIFSSSCLPGTVIDVIFCVQVFGCTDLCKFCLAVHVEEWFSVFGGIIKRFLNLHISGNILRHKFFIRCGSLFAGIGCYYSSQNHPICLRTFCHPCEYLCQVF